MAIADLLGKVEPRRSAALSFTAAAAIVVAVGALLRIAGARGDLWLDEIWSLSLVEKLTFSGQVLWDISQDNNHPLNSLWLYAVGPDAAPLLQRGLSIALGTMTVAAAGFASSRLGRPAALIAMALFAVSYPLVHYGSEARGYAGLVLFSLLAIGFLQRLHDEDDAAMRYALGLAVGLGFLSHLAMAPAALILGLWTAATLWLRNGSLQRTQAATLLIFRPALVCAVAVVACHAAGALRHKFAIHGINDFTFADFVSGYGDLIRLMVGIPEEVPAWLCLVGALAAVAAGSFVWRRRGDGRASLYVLGVIALPAAMLAARLPNVEFSRHFLFSGTVFLLFVADALGRLWVRGGKYRALAAAILIAAAAGNAVSLAKFFQHGRGSYMEAVAMMAAAGNFTYASDHEFRTSMTVRHFARLLGVTAEYVAEEDRCRNNPKWFVIEDPTVQRELPIIKAGAPHCALRYEQVRMFSHWGLSGQRWALYARMP